MSVLRPRSLKQVVSMLQACTQPQAGPLTQVSHVQGTWRGDQNVGAAAGLLTPILLGPLLHGFSLPNPNIRCSLLLPMK